MAAGTKPGGALSDRASKALSTAEAHKARRAQCVPRGDAEAHRRRGIARLKAATGGGRPKVLRLDITNVLNENDYTAQLRIGAKGAVANVILDTGSSTLAVEPSAYSGAGDTGLSPSTLIQLVTYNSGGWAGPVVNTTLTLGAGAGQVVLPNCPIAITSVQDKGIFKGVTGIMGLAYNGLNTAFDFKTHLVGRGKASTFPWPFGKALKTFRRLLQQARAKKIHMKPYFDQIEEGGVVANKFAFYTLRSRVSRRRGTKRTAVAADPLNKGYFILGGGEEQKDLYRGPFVTVKVVHKLFYNTNLKSVRVEGCTAHPAAALQQRHRATLSSNSIVDSGTSHLAPAKDVYQAILHGLQQWDPAFIRAIKKADKNRGSVSAASLNLAQWPNIYFTLEGENGQDVELACTPQTYWQADFPAAGQAVFQIRRPFDQINQSVLGLPLMNNYFTVFDRTQHVNGVIRFAKINPPVYDR